MGAREMAQQSRTLAALAEDEGSVPSTSQGDSQPCAVFTREDPSDVGTSKYKVFISQPATTLGVQDLDAVLSLSQGGLLSTKSF